MPKELEHRLDELIHEIKEIKKQILIEKLVEKQSARSRVNRWQKLGTQVSTKWRGPSAVEEIRLQREKGS
jgi:hypothetical protein